MKLQLCRFLLNLLNGCFSMQLGKINNPNFIAYKSLKEWLRQKLAFLFLIRKIRFSNFTYFYFWMILLLRQIIFTFQKESFRENMKTNHDNW